jgi:hypothetical protein
MIKSESLHNLLEQFEFVPQAIISAPVYELAKRYGGNIEKGQDDLDWYEGSGGSIYGTPFALMHYRGHPDFTSTIYLPFEIQKVDEITKTILKITDELDVKDKIEWQRKDEFPDKADKKK